MYRVKEGLFKGFKWQPKPLENLQAWRRKDSNGKKIYKPLRQYIGVLKVLKNQGK
jgi:hypothetical protein